jgi:hypothetical protein
MRHIALPYAESTSNDFEAVKDEAGDTNYIEECGTALPEEMDGPSSYWTKTAGYKWPVERRLRNGRSYLTSFTPVGKPRAVTGCVWNDRVYENQQWRAEYRRKWMGRQGYADWLASGRNKCPRYQVRDGVLVNLPEKEEPAPFVSEIAARYRDTPWSAANLLRLIASEKKADKSSTVLEKLRGNPRRLSDLADGTRKFNDEMPARAARRK